MLKKTYRIKKNKEFVRTYKKGKVFFSPSIVMYAVNNEKAETRFGFSVSKKVGNAVFRNRVKRKLREICRLNMHKIKGGYDIIIVARAIAASKKYSEILNETEKLLNKAKVIIIE